MATVKNVFDLV